MFPHKNTHPNNSNQHEDDLNDFMAPWRFNGRTIYNGHLIPPPVATSSTAQAEAPPQGRNPPKESTSGPAIPKLPKATDAVKASEPKRSCLKRKRSSEEVSARKRGGAVRFQAPNKEQRDKPPSPNEIDKHIQMKNGDNSSSKLPRHRSGNNTTHFSGLANGDHAKVAQVPAGKGKQVVRAEPAANSSGNEILGQSKAGFCFVVPKPMSEYPEQVTTQGEKKEKGRSNHTDTSSKSIEIEEPRPRNRYLDIVKILKAVFPDAVPQYADIELPKDLESGDNVGGPAAGFFLWYTESKIENRWPGLRAWDILTLSGELAALSQKIRWENADVEGRNEMLYYCIAEFIEKKRKDWC